MYYNIRCILDQYVNLHLLRLLSFIFIFYIFGVNCIQVYHVHIRYISSTVHKILGYVLMQFDIFMGHLNRYTITIVDNWKGNIIRIWIKFMIYVQVRYEIGSISSEYIFRNRKIVMFILALFEYFLKLSFTFFYLVNIFIRAFQDIKIIKN
jgi:hypothetical protein